MAETRTQERLTERQRALATHIVDAKFAKIGVTKAELARRAGYSLNTATNSRQLAHTLFRQPAVQNEVQRQFKERGLDVLAQSKIQEILNLQADDPKTAQVQLDAVKEVHKVMGSYADEVRTTRKLSLKLPGGL